MGRDILRKSGNGLGHGLVIVLRDTWQVIFWGISNSRMDNEIIT